MRGVLRAAASRRLVIGTLALLALRLGLAMLRVGPLVVADEAGYLLNARALTGGTPGQLERAPFYRGGYSAVIAPIVAIHADPRTTYRLVLVVNAMLAASLVPLLYLLLTRCFRVPARAAVWPALAGAAYPSVTIFSQAAWSENLLFPLTVTWLLCLGALLDGRSARSRILWGLAVGVCAAALFAVHGRMIVAVALTIAVLAALALARRLSPWAACAGIVATGLGLVAVHRFDSYLIATNYGGHAPDEVGTRLSTVRDLGGLAALARNLVGEAWYILVAGLGLLLVVALANGRAFVRRIRRGELESRAVLTLTLLALGAGLLVVSALSFRDLERADMLIYGRYVEIVMPPLLALALVRLASSPPTTRGPAAVAIVGAATVLVVALRTGVHPLRAANRWNVASLPSVTLNLGTLSLLGAGAAAALAIAASVFVSRRRPHLLAPLVLVFFLPTTALVEHNPVLSGQSSVYPSGWTSPGGKIDPRTIAYDTIGSDGISLYVYQWFMPRTRLLFYSGVGRPPASYVIGPRSWVGPAGLSPHPVWHDPGRDRVIFRVALSR
jgi:4-amino-4-deoxy-L-arabinose transferase-like glycosyltransferase